MAATSPLPSAHEPPRRRRTLLFPFPLHSYFPIILLLAVIACFVPLAEAALRNVTVDDELGDELTKVKPTFLPTTAGVWEGQECGGCRVKPDPALAFQNTYNAATYRKEAGVDPVEFSFQFTGECHWPCKECDIEVNGLRYGGLRLLDLGEQRWRGYHDSDGNQLHRRRRPSDLLPPYSWHHNRF